MSDGRRGHDNQSLGLTEALARRAPVRTVDVPVRGGASGAVASLAGRPPGPAPSLVLGAGHATHLALIIAARRQRARSVVLMNPSLPRALFDLCLVPVHDGVAEGGNVLLSLGALNRLRPSRERDPQQSLILVGGPSRHHRWSRDAIVGQVRAVMQGSPSQRWTAAGSPRTPAATLRALAELPGLETVPFQDTGSDWLPDRLSRAATVWVSEDSVSMAYEAASSGAAVGLLEVPARRRGRVQAAARALVDAGHAVPIHLWRRGTGLAASARPLQEADRLAGALLDRWPDLR